MPATVTVRPLDVAESHVPVITGFPVFEVTASMVGAVSGGGGGGGCLMMTSPADTLESVLPALSRTVATTS